MSINQSIEFNKIGPELTLSIQLKYEDLEVFEYPESCTKCVIGFSSKADCGRNVPFQQSDWVQRPKTCKLRKVSLLDLIQRSKEQSNE